MKRVVVFLAALLLLWGLVVVVDLGGGRVPVTVLGLVALAIGCVVTAWPVASWNQIKRAGVVTWKGEDSRIVAARFRALGVVMIAAGSLLLSAAVR